MAFNILLFIILKLVVTFEARHKITQDSVVGEEHRRAADREYDDGGYSHAIVGELVEYHGASLDDGSLPRTPSRRD